MTNIEPTESDRQAGKDSQHGSRLAGELNDIVAAASTQLEQPSQLAGGRYEDPAASKAPEGLVYEKLEGNTSTKIETSDIAPHPIAMGETEIVVQRHGDYIRDRANEARGSITEESAVEVATTARGYFEKFLEQIPLGERDKVDIVFVSSDTSYAGGGQRSMETGSISQAAAREVLAQNGVPETNIHNSRGGLKGDGGPRPMTGIREPQFLDNNPAFAQHLLDNYSQKEGPDGQKQIDVPFWIAFETDREADLRKEMGAEGPDDIADRTGHSLDVLARYAQAWHANNPDRRLIIWVDTHYDTISPYVRREIFKQPDYKEEALAVALGGGITIDIDRAGQASTQLSGQEWAVPVMTAAQRREQRER